MTAGSSPNAEVRIVHVYDVERSLLILLSEEEADAMISSGDKGCDSNKSGDGDGVGL